MRDWLVCPTHVLRRFGRALCDKEHCRSAAYVIDGLPRVVALFGLARRLPETRGHADRAEPLCIGASSEGGLEAPMVHLLELLSHSKASLAPPSKPQDLGRYFLFVGRLEKIKGLQTLIPFFAASRASLWIAGTGHVRAQATYFGRGQFKYPIPRW